jgi:hypothetical protein
MTREVNYFQRILKHQYPTLHNKVNVNVSAKSNYQQCLGMDGRMRAELNYNSPVEYNIEIIFPTYNSLYYDIEFYVNFVWSPNEIQKKFDYVGRYHFKFTV